jgi:poly-gamma-glutamate synthesis protein (capsule biosynthesis protein)
VAGQAPGTTPGTSPPAFPPHGRPVPGPAHASARRVLGISLATALTFGLLGLAIAGPGGPRSGAQVTTSAVEGPPPPAADTPGEAPPAPDESTPPTIADRRWRLLAGGDSLLRRSTTADPFARLRPRLIEAELAIVNVETAIATSGTPQQKTYVFRAEPRFATLLSQAGVDAVSLANNHALDYGRDALLETAEHLSANGVVPFGAGADIDEALAPATFTVKGTTVAILGASQIIPSASWLATADRAGIASAGKHTIDANTERLLTAVRNARAVHDVVIVFMHWGIEGDDCPSGVQVRLGRLLRDAGADAVIGAHPHVLQPIVADRGPDGDGVIAYSLGNFIWDPRTGRTADTGVLDLRFDGSTLVGMELHPHRLDGNGWAAAVSNDTTSARIRAAVARRCAGARGVASWSATG